MLFTNANSRQRAIFQDILQTCSDEHIQQFEAIASRSYSCDVLPPAFYRLVVEERLARSLKRLQLGALVDGDKVAGWASTHAQESRPSEHVWAPVQALTFYPTTREIWDQNR